MRLIEAIIAANGRASLTGGKTELLSAEFAEALPLAALTCIDARLNKLVPEMLGVPEDKLVWLRNAGNVVTGPMSSTMRSLGLACAIKGAKEIAVIGHSDCLVAKSGTLQLLENFAKLGIERARLPDNLAEFFGVFSSERQNVINACNNIRQSPLIGPKMPVHGLLVDVQNGRLEWLVNGYESFSSTASELARGIEAGANRAQAVLGDLQEMKLGDMKFPETKIGELATKAGEFIQKIGEIAAANPQAETPREMAVQAVTDFARQIVRTKLYKVVGDDKKIYGPITGEKVLQWLAEDRIDANTLIQPEGSSEWKTLERLASVFKRGPIPVPPPLQPKPGFKAKHQGRR